MDRAKANLGQLEGETVRQTITQSKVESDEQSVSMGNLLLRQIYTQLAMHDMANEAFTAVSGDCI